MNVHLYDMAKVREQDYIAEFARHNRVREPHAGVIATVSRLLRRGDRDQH